MHRLAKLVFGVVVALLELSHVPTSRAECPVGKVIEIDFDLAGSGYSEETQNWDTWKRVWPGARAADMERASRGMTPARTGADSRHPGTRAGAVAG